MSVASGFSRSGGWRPSSARPSSRGAGVYWNDETLTGRETFRPTTPSCLGGGGGGGSTWGGSTTWGGSAWGGASESTHSIAFIATGGSCASKARLDTQRLPGVGVHGDDDDGASCVSGMSGVSGMSRMTERTSSRIGRSGLEGGDWARDGSGRPREKGGTRLQAIQSGSRGGGGGTARSRGGRGTSKGSPKGASKGASKPRRGGFEHVPSPLAMVQEERGGGGTTTSSTQREKQRFTGLRAAAATDSRDRRDKRDTRRDGRRARRRGGKASAEPLAPLRPVYDNSATDDPGLVLTEDNLQRHLFAMRHDNVQVKTRGGGGQQGQQEGRRRADQSGRSDGGGRSGGGGLDGGRVGDGGRGGPTRRGGGGGGATMGKP